MTVVIYCHTHTDVHKQADFPEIAHLLGLGVSLFIDHNLRTVYIFINKSLNLLQSDRFDRLPDIIDIDASFFACAKLFSKRELTTNL